MVFDAMQDVDSNLGPQENSPGPEAFEPPEPEYTSETLYIQNLNEKIQVNGQYVSTVYSFAPKLMAYFQL
jgi:hypothetical protein